MHTQPNESVLLIADFFGQPENGYIWIGKRDAGDQGARVRDGSCEDKGLRELAA